MTRRARWIVLVIGAVFLHAVVVRVAGDSQAKLVINNLVLVLAGSLAVINCVITALRVPMRQQRIVWLALGGGLVGWLFSAVAWTIRELLLDEVAPPPSWLDVPFFLLAPSFAVALLVFRTRRPSRALQIRQLADLGIVTAVIAIVGTLVLAEPLRQSDSAYAIVAVGYPGFYLAVVVVALHSLVRDDWGHRRVVLGTLIWAQVAFATVDLLYGAKVLSAVYQTGIEDTLWLIGMLGMTWAAAEERALVEGAGLPEHPNTSWRAVVGAIAIIVVAALSADSIGRLERTEWMIIAIAAITAITCVGVRMWTGDRAEDAYLSAIAAGEQTQRVLDEERVKVSKLRAFGTLAGGTAHEVNNLLQAIVGNLELLRRRAKRGEDIQTFLASIERALAALAAQVGDLRKLAPADTARGMVLILPGGDRDGSLGVVLAEAGFAPAALPDVETAVRAAKHDGAYAIVASSQEADALEARKVDIPIIRRDTIEVIDAVLRIVEIVRDRSSRQRS